MIEDRIREMRDESRRGPQGVMADRDGHTGPQGNMNERSFSAWGIQEIAPPQLNVPPVEMPHVVPVEDKIDQLRNEIEQLRWSVEALREAGDDFPKEYPVPDYPPWPWHLTSLGYKLKGATCTVYPGYLSIRGRVQASLAASSNLSLTGSTAWVYAEIDDDSDTTITVGFSAARDDTSIGKIRKYLYRFDRVTATQYKLGMICNVGDGFLDTPA